METEIGTLRSRCTRTGHEADSGIVTDTDTLNIIRMFQVRVRCPVCEDAHHYGMIEAKLGTFQAIDRSACRRSARKLASFVNN